MPTIRERVEIRKPAETVAHFIADPENTSLFDVNVLELHQESTEARGKGTRDRGIARVAGRKMPFVTEIVEWEPLRTVYRTIEAPMAWTMDFRVDPLDGEHCAVTQEIHADNFGGFFGKLGETVVTKMVSHDLKASLSNLKVLLEES
jgi:hypothetical protein